MFSQVTNVLAGGAKLRLPVLSALAIAFSVLWVIFIITLDVLATYVRQEALSEMTEQVDDQIYQKSEDFGYQMLSAANLISSQSKVIDAVKSNKPENMNNLLKQFYQNSSSSDSLLSTIQFFNRNGEILASIGINTFSEEQNKLFSESESKTGIHLANNGEISLYAVSAISIDQKVIGYVQVSKPYTDLVNELAALNKVTLYLLANKSLMDQQATQDHQSIIGMQPNWELFNDLVLCSIVQGNINLDHLASTVNTGMNKTSSDDIFLQDKFEVNEQRINLALLPIFDSEHKNIGQILMLKNIDEAYNSYLTSLWVTSISFGVVISLIFISFWFFLSKIERSITGAEQQIIKAKIQAEKARDQAEKSNQQAQEANKIKSEFLAKMSHELRTPLNAIIGITEMMCEDAEEFGDDDYVEPLGRVLRSGKHLLALINDILDLSKIEAGKMELHPESFDISLFIGDINRTCEPLARKNNNELIVNIDKELTDIYADSTRLKQIIFNLISNACKFTNDGKVTLAVIKTEFSGQAAVKFEITDSGIGMNPEQLSMLFQDFQQVDSSATRKYEGTGLGLSISQKLCQLMEGDIFVTSELNKGSIFSVIIPLNISNISLNPSYKKEITNDKSERIFDSANKATVLVVEDDENMVQMLKHHFDRNDIIVEVAKDGNQALQKARANPPTLITLDINLPNLNGWDTLAAMRADELLKDIPIVMVTVQEEKKKGLELGASEYLTKPINKMMSHP